MHIILLLGYFSDLSYGFGRHMPGLYRAVTVAGIVSLALQQMQFFIFGDITNREKTRLLMTDMLLIGAVGLNMLLIYSGFNNKLYFDLLGFISVFTGIIYACPQILKNHYRRSCIGISKAFILIAITASFLDLITSLCLNWDWPSRVGPPLAIIQNVILLSQCLFWSASQKISILNGKFKWRFI